jgi:IS5 family transposase
MDRVVPWAALVDLVAPHAPEGKKGRPPFPVETMLRIHFMQQWFTLSDPAMEEALHDMPLFREFAGLGNWDERLPDESTILRFRHLLEKHKLAEQMLATVNDMLRTKGLMLRSRHGGRRHADRRAEFDQERQRRARPRDAPEPRRATSGTSA